MGIVPLSEASVTVAASAPHRAEAFAGREGDNRRDQGAGPDLEEGGGRLGGRDDTTPDELRALPAVHELAASLEAQGAGAGGGGRRGSAGHRRAARGAAQR